MDQDMEKIFYRDTDKSEILGANKKNENFYFVTCILVVGTLPEESNHDLPINLLTLGNEYSDRLHNL